MSPEHKDELPREVSYYYNSYLCPDCEEEWGGRSDTPGHPADCPSCGREKIKPQSWQPFYK